MFSAKYFCSETFLQRLFLACQNGRKNSQNNGPTIIVKSVGKVAFFTSSFPSFPAPGPMLIKTLMFVRVIILLYLNIE